MKNSYILITGGTGFTGSHLAERFSEQSKNVIITYRKLHKKSYFYQRGLHKKTILEKIDITNRKKVLALGKKYPIEYVIHLAAAADVTDAYYNPVKTLDSNIGGAINILELIRTSKTIRCALIASSDKAYGKTNKAYREAFPLVGDHPYEVSKASTDLLAHSYYKTYGLPIIVTRFGNIYGPGDIHFERIVPGICKALITNTSLSIRSNGKLIRNYIYIKDVVNAYQMLFTKFSNLKGNAYNFASPDALSTLQVIKKFETILGKKVKYTVQNTAKNEIPFQKLDSSKAKDLGWKPNFNFESSIMETYNWYKSFLKK